MKPRHAWITYLRRRLGRTRLIYALKRRARMSRVDMSALTHATVRDYEPRRATPRVLSSHPAGQLNVVIVSYADFNANTAVYIHRLATELRARGTEPIVVVPGNPRSVGGLGGASYVVRTYRQARRERFAFSNGRGPDLIHAFTPREIVRTLVCELGARDGCPYVVHLEDNEGALLEAELGGPSFAELRALPTAVLDKAVPRSLSHPVHAQRFLEEASAITAVIEKLLETAPSHVPGVVAWPGHDEAVLGPAVSRAEARHSLRLRPDDLVLAYTGNVHEANADEIRSLFRAVASLRSDGYPVVLVKTGWDSIPRSHLGALGDGLRDLGWQHRNRLPAILAAADVLVQPGGPGPFNDYRFPSKLPDYLASGRPVVLPHTNIGLHLAHRADAFLLERGDHAEIHEAVLELAADRELRDCIGQSGQQFATRELTWARAADAVEQAYGASLERSR